MPNSKKIVASLLAAAGLTMGGVAAATVGLPDQASDTARDAVVHATTTTVETPAVNDDKADQQDDQADAADTDEQKQAGTESEGERPTDTHGYEVSEFVHSTDLTGREKGQAVADLASNGRSSEHADAADEQGDQNDQADADDQGEDEGNKPADAGATGQQHRQDHGVDAADD